MNVDGIIAAIPGMDAAKRKGVRKNAQISLADPSKAEHGRRVLAALDEAEGKDAATLSEQVRLWPVARRVVEAFKYEPMTETEHRLVQVLLDNPGLTSEGLSRALGWGGQAWHLHFGEMCKRREHRLWPSDQSAARDASFYSSILADLSPDNRWTCRADAMAGFAELGLRPATRT